MYGVPFFLGGFAMSAHPKMSSGAASREVRTRGHPMSRKASRREGVSVGRLRGRHRCISLGYDRDIILDRGGQIREWSFCMSFLPSWRISPLIFGKSSCVSEVHSLSCDHSLLCVHLTLFLCARFWSFFFDMLSSSLLFSSQPAELFLTTQPPTNTPNHPHTHPHVHCKHILKP